MKYISLFTAIIFSFACGTHSGSASDDHLIQALDSVPKVPVKPSELPEGVTLSEASLKADVLQIIVQRGGKDPKDRWIVDLFKGDIRIRKSRTDNTVYPSGASVEFWRKEPNGGWRRLLTA